MADNVFKVLADPTRRAILDELRERDGQTLFELCGRLAMRRGSSASRQAISQHLAALEGPGWCGRGGRAASSSTISTRPRWSTC
ncbi:hypothetical protein GCM10029992_15690 [Glycomyces albus]